ncbi:regulatory LuxR family protein [Actinocorallia herbida]|uniref:Regulatory LuxR family protein n=1 Tax=Actinocorallia herbida TaxID=58109 RepID=A0A3N1D2N4_9ACTN|nr:LuxR family transcriptional regulator [Actinocorallia herbida]ROO87750.1 regulatory LuxR family protein [Actinocorallia herbida]
MTGHRGSGPLRTPRAAPDPEAGAPAGGDGEPSPAEVRERLERLSPDAGRLLRVAAALGLRIEPEQLADITARPVAGLLRPMRDAIAAGLVTETEQDLSFRNGAVRETVQGTLPIAERRALRRKAAALRLAHGAPLAAVAEALAEAAEPGEPEAVALLQRAMREPEAAPATVARLAVWALGLIPPSDPSRPRLVADVLPLLIRAGARADASELSRAALERPGLPGPEAARIRLGNAAVQPQPAEAVRRYREVVAQGDAPARLNARALALLCRTLAFLGRLDEAEGLLTTAEREASACDSRAALATVRAAESLLRAHRQYYEDALSGADLAVEMDAGPATGGMDTAPQEAWRSFLRGHTGHADLALREMGEGLERARRRGDAGAERLWGTVMCRTLLKAGRIAHAADMAEEFAGTDDLVGSHGSYVAGRAELLTGRVEEALARAAVLSQGVDPLIRQAGLWLGVQAAARAEDGERIAAAADVIDGLTAYISRPADAADPPVLVRIALLGGRPEAARRALDLAELREARNPGLPLFAAVAAHARGLVLDDVAELLRAVELLEESARPLALASALEDAGTRLLGTDRDRGVPLLQRALRIHRDAGADGEAGRLRHKLHRAGVRSGRRSRRSELGWDALTEAERQVVAVISEGVTNREAADRLFLSHHTIGTHLMHAYRKLGVGSRVELARVVLDRAGPEARRPATR